MIDTHMIGTVVRLVDGVRIVKEALTVHVETPAPARVLGEDSTQHRTQSRRCSPDTTYSTHVE